MLAGIVPEVLYSSSMVRNRRSNALTGPIFLVPNCCWSDVRKFTVTGVSYGSFTQLLSRPLNV